jgi:GT2 family glycosyltransferase
MHTEFEPQTTRIAPSSTDSGVEVDIIILDWNRPDYTIKAIQSALNQTGVTCKVWVVDQGSESHNRDKLSDFCAGQSDVHVRWLEQNVGVPAGRNIATQLGSAPYVVSLDNDAVFGDPQCVARAIARLKEQPKLGGVAFRILDAETGNERQFWDYPEAYLGADLESFEVTRFLGGGHALRREAFERAGRYDETLFFGGEERDVAWRMIRHGYTLRLYRDLQVHHRTTTAAKFEWNDQRYFYMVRNALYINHKFGAGLTGYARGTLSFLLRGMRNGVGFAAMRGIVAAGAMNVRFSLNEHQKNAHRLTPELRRYIADTDLKSNETPLQKLRRQLTILPKL